MTTRFRTSDISDRRSYRLGFCLLVFYSLTVSAMFSGTVNADDPAEKPKSTEVVSPLHALLGIDPVTGEFKQPPASGSQKSDLTAPDAPWSNQHVIPDPAQIGGPNQADSLRALDDLLKQVASNKAHQQPLLGAMVDVLGSNNELAQWNRTLAWVSAGLMLIYPVGLILAEFFAYLWGSRDPRLSAVDRTHLRIRLARGATLGLAMAALILLGTLLFVNVRWWSDPLKLTGLTVAMALLAVCCVTISMLMKQATSERSIALLHELRDRQAELEKGLMALGSQLKK